MLPIAAPSPAVDRATGRTARPGRSTRAACYRPQGPACDSGAYELDKAATVTITEGPTGTITVNDAEFRFQASEPGVDRRSAGSSGPGQTGGFAECYKSNAQPYGDLADGPYTFSVRAVDAAFPNPPVTTRTFMVDTAPPNTTITGGPIGLDQLDTTRDVHVHVERDAARRSSARSTAPRSAACPRQLHRALVAGLAHVPGARHRRRRQHRPDARLAHAGRSTPSRPTRRSTRRPDRRGELDQRDVHVHLDRGAARRSSARSTAPRSAPARPATPACRRARTRSRSAPSTPPATPTRRPPRARGPSTPSRPTRRSTRGPTGSVSVDHARRSRSRSTEAGATFQCALDGAAFGACPAGYTGLSQGSHTFQVRATDAAGNPDAHARDAHLDRRHHRARHDDHHRPDRRGQLDQRDVHVHRPPRPARRSSARSTAPPSAPAPPATPASRRARTPSRSAPSTPPATPTRRPPRGPGPSTRSRRTPRSTPARPASVSSTSATFTFTSTEAGATFQCALDGAAFGACPAELHRPRAGLAHLRRSAPSTPPATPTPRPPRAPGPSTRSRPTRRSTGPDRRREHDHARRSRSPPPRRGATFQCSLDGAAFGACPAGYTGPLAGLAHVRRSAPSTRPATPDPTPASRTWTVDTVAPDTTIDSRPDRLRQHDQRRRSRSPPPRRGATFECRSTAPRSAPCPAGYTGPRRRARTRSTCARSTPAATPTRRPRRARGRSTPSRPNAPVVTSPGQQRAADRQHDRVQRHRRAGLDGRGARGHDVAGQRDRLGHGQLHDRARRGAGRPARLRGAGDRRREQREHGHHAAGHRRHRAAGHDDRQRAERADHHRHADVHVLVRAGRDVRVRDRRRRAHRVHDAVHAADAAARARTRSRCARRRPAGNRDNTPATRSFTVDTVAPEHHDRHRARAARVSLDRRATFTFSSTEAGATFQCALDGAAFGACPASYTGLAQGSHTFAVRATDAAGNTDHTPASRTWTVDTTAPNTTIDTGPTGTVNSRDATFTFSSPDGDRDVPVLARRRRVRHLPRELHAAWPRGRTRSRSRATDAAGNTDATPATRTWTVDISGPEAIIDGGPIGLTRTAGPIPFHSADQTDRVRVPARRAGTQRHVPDLHVARGLRRPAGRRAHVPSARDRHDRQRRAGGDPPVHARHPDDGAGRHRAD